MKSICIISSLCISMISTLFSMDNEQTQELLALKKKKVELLEKKYMLKVALMSVRENKSEAVKDASKQVIDSAKKDLVNYAYRQSTKRK